MALAPEQIDELRRAFDELDTNKDGFVTPDELRNIFQACFQEDAGEGLLDLMFAMADADGDGKVNFDEFCNAAMYNDMPNEDDMGDMGEGGFGGEFDDDE